MAQTSRGRRLMGEINVVPYIDVMLVLLIIFMITAPLLTQGVKVDLPKAGCGTSGGAAAPTPGVVRGSRRAAVPERRRRSAAALDEQTVAARAAAVLRPRTGHAGAVEG